MKRIITLLLVACFSLSAGMCMADRANWPTNLLDHDERDPTHPIFMVSSEDNDPDPNVADLAFKPAFSEAVVTARQYTLLHASFDAAEDWLLYQDPPNGPPTLVATAVTSSASGLHATRRILFRILRNSIRSGARLYVALRIAPKDIGPVGHPRTIDTLIFTHDPALVTSTPYLAFAYSLGPVLSEELDNGSRTAVLQAPLEIKVPRLVPTPYASAFYLSLKSLLSTQSRDTKAGFNLTLVFDQTFFPSPPLRYVLMQNRVSAISNLTGTNRAIVASSHFQAPVPWTNFTLGNILHGDEQLRLEVWPVRFEYREKIDPDFSSSHSRTFLYAPSVRAGLDNLLIFPKGTNVDENIALSFSGQVWFFPSELGRGVTAARKQESRFDAQLRVPLWKDKKIYGILSFGTGANPDNGYTRSVQLGFFIQIFGQSIKAAQVGTP